MAGQEVLEESSEPINCKKWVLKVSIHCEGCKRKVKKILQQVQGVFEIDIDTKLQKVTVIGDVDADSLLRKLTKAGKHAELWPVKAEEKLKRQGKAEKITARESDEDNSKITKNDKEAVKPPTVKAEQVQEPTKNTQSGGANVSKSAVVGGGAVPKAQEPSRNNQGCASKAGGENGGAAKNNEESSVAANVMEGTAKTCTGDQAGKEPKPEEKKPDTSSAAAAQSPVKPEKKGDKNETTDGAGKVVGNDCGNSGKKKKKKGQNGNNAGGEQSRVTPAGLGSENHEDGPPTASVTANPSPPHHPSYYDYPPPYYGPPPVYAVSYNTAHPTSYTASYYAAPPPNSYVYAYPGYSGMPERQPPPPPPPSELDLYPRQPLDSFEIFSDENPNGCSVM